MQLRFFRPGMILPPGGPLGPKLPENTSVVVTREGDKPAKIVVKQGEKKWEITEDEINKLPEALRPAVEQMLGLGPVSFPETSGLLPEPGQGAKPGCRPAGRKPCQGDMPAPALPGESRLEKRLDDLSRQVEQLRKAVEQSQPAHPGKDKPAPPVGDNKSSPPVDRPVLEIAKEYLPLQFPTAAPLLGGGSKATDPPLFFAQTVSAARLRTAADLTYNDAVAVACATAVSAVLRLGKPRQLRHG